MPHYQWTVEDALGRIPGAGGARFVELFRRGTLSIELYAPAGNDPQEPHRQDEVYVVVRGEGMFRNGETLEPFRPGDVLFVPAGVPHRFEDFTEDFVVWVIFYGPRGERGRRKGPMQPIGVRLRHRKKPSSSQPKAPPCR